MRVHNRIDAAAISLPHGAETLLAANVPELHRNVALGNLLHAKSNRRHYFLVITASLQSGAIISSCDIGEAVARTVITFTRVDLPEFCSPTSVLLRPEEAPQPVDETRPPRHRGLRNRGGRTRGGAGGCLREVAHFPRTTWKTLAFYADIDVLPVLACALIHCLTVTLCELPAKRGRGEG